MAAYLIRMHTRSNTNEFYTHLINLFPTTQTEGLKKALANKFGDKISFMEFIGMPSEDFAKME